MESFKTNQCKKGLKIAQLLKMTQYQVNVGTAGRIKRKKKGEKINLKKYFLEEEST